MQNPVTVEVSGFFFFKGTITISFLQLLFNYKQNHLYDLIV